MPGSPVARRWNCWSIIPRGVKVIGASLTRTENVVLLLRPGEPLSATRTVTEYSCSACEAVGVQVNTPVAGSIVAPAGASGPRLKDRLLRGRSVSDAEMAILNSAPGRTICGATGSIFGGLFTSLTTTVKLTVSLIEGDPLSDTRRVIRLVLGPWASVGFQMRI